MTQIKTECEALRNELSILKADSEADQIALQKLSENVMKLRASLDSLQTSLTDTENALTIARGQLDEARTQLTELKASLTKSKTEALWINIGIGAGGLTLGALIGIILGMVAKQ